MSVSSRDRKSIIYAEVERLRDLLDQREQCIASLEAENEELRNSLSASQPNAALRREPERSERGTRNLMMRRLAVTCKASVKWVDGQGFRQYKEGALAAHPRAPDRLRREGARGMKRQDLRNREPKFTGAGKPAPWPKRRRALKLSTVLKVLGVLVLLALLYATSPSRTFPECRGDSVPRYCVD